MRFELKAVDAGDEVVAIALDAVDEIAARQVARERGFTILTIAHRGVLHGFTTVRRDRFPVSLFAIELLALLDTGLNVVESLQTLAEKDAGGEIRRVLNELLEALYRGAPLSKALASHPHTFSSLFIATIRSSERTGDLKEALSRYVTYQEELDRVRNKIVAALLYPAILAVVGALVLVFLVLYVVPRFARVYEGLSAPLPLLSSLLLGIGRWIGQNGAMASILVVGIFGGAAYALAHARIRARITERMWRVPSIGRRLYIYQLARFYRTVGMLLRAGIPATTAFEMVSSMLPSNLAARLSIATTLICEGRSISSALTAAQLATPVATRIMSVGDRGGRMGELMDRIARFYDDDTARFTDTFVRVFEPVLMAVLGLAVGLVVVLMYMPIFELAGSLQ